MKYNFPPVKFVKDHNIPKQLRHVLSEADELYQELHRTQINHDHVWDELCDLLHSIETLIRLDEKSYKDAYIRTIRKNKNRGYYEQPPVEKIENDTTLPDFLLIHQSIKRLEKSIHDEKNETKLRLEAVKNIIDTVLKV